MSIVFLLFPLLKSFAGGVHEVSFRNSQGVAISFHHGVPRTSPAAGTIIIFPGMFMTAVPYSALVDAAMSSGYEVFILESRYSHHYVPCPGICPSSNGSDLIDVDFKELIEEVTSLASTKNFHWIGHSFGGIAALSLLSRPAALASDLHPKTLTISGATDEISDLNGAIRAVNLMQSITAPFWNPFGISLIPIFCLDGSKGSIPIDVLHQMFRNPDRNFVDTAGRPFVQLRHLKTPVFTLIGSRDLFVSARKIEAFLDRIPAGVVRDKVYIKGNHDLIMDEGHVRDLWPSIEDFFTRMNANQCSLSLAAAISKAKLSEH